MQTSWDELKAVFTNKFAVSKSISATQRMNVKNQLLSLKQGSKHISKYIIIHQGSPEFVLKSSQRAG